ncbi:hypothetical protein CH276_07435 [Rhodococcus sp. 06-470-2]|nr:hypothetical protein CH276_07435 [Rhodococcus sp. 06-470-2]OZE58692.1 hypothetical protein CH265_21720 [Rhodococcus sp. 05-2221-1B]
MSRSTVTIESRDGDGADPFDFIVRDESGLPFIIVDEGTPRYPDYKLRDLYESVTLNSSGADEKIVALLHELGIEEPPF